MKNLFNALFSLVIILVFPSNASAAVELSGSYAFGSIRSLGELLSALVPTAFIIAGIIVAFFFFTASFDLIISQGDKNAIAAAREKMVHAIIGMLLLILSFVVVRYLPFVLFSGVTDARQTFWFF